MKMVCDKITLEGLDYDELETTVVELQELLEHNVTIIEELLQSPGEISDSDIQKIRFTLQQVNYNANNCEAIQAPANRLMRALGGIK